MKKANITLDVYINRKFCGIATKIDFNHLCFQYDVNYVNTETPLSLSMPIVPNKKYKNVFRN
jgi:HipA-like protein